MFADVSFPISSYQTFSYKVPKVLKEQVAIGVRVKVPFGNRKAQGIVVGIQKTTEFKGKISEIESLIDSVNMSYIHLSKSKNEEIKNYDTIIIDSIGILLELYKYADIAYIGSGFSTGVHSVIEPLSQGCVLCYGPKIDILDEAVEITALEIGKIINNSEELLNIFKLIDDKEKLEEIQAKGLEYINSKLNATEQIIKEL